MMSENDKNVSLIVHDFHMKWGKRNKLSFFKWGNFESVSVYPSCTKGGGGWDDPQKVF